MPSLIPGQHVSTPPSERLRIMLGGDGADGAVIKVESTGGVMTTRAKGGAETGTDLVVGAKGPATGIVSVFSADGCRPITGRVAMKLMSSQAGGSTSSPAKRTWDVRGLDVEGRTRLDVLRLTVDDRLVWTVESLVEDAPPLPAHPTGGPGERIDGPRELSAASGATSRARVAWGDRERVSRQIMVMVDRSASMAWAFQPDGALEMVCEGVGAAATSALDATSSVTWWSYGSLREPKPQRIMPASGESAAQVVASLKPELFSSGSHLDLDRLKELDCSDVVMVTDNLVAAREAAAGATAGPVAAVILIGAAADDELIPAEEQQAQIALQDARVAVLPLPGEAGPRTDGDQVRQMYVDSVARFVLRHIESSGARDGG